MIISGKLEEKMNRIIIDIIINNRLINNKIKIINNNLFNNNNGSKIHNNRDIIYKNFKKMNVHLFN